MSTPHPPKMDYRKALLSTEADRASAAKIIDDARAAEEKIVEDIRAAEFAELEKKNLLKVLPEDVRMIIWHMLFHRDGTILPGFRSWETWGEHKVGHDWFRHAGPDGKCYAYRWNETSSKDLEFRHGRYGDLAKPFTISKITDPTYDQRELIKQGEYQLPSVLQVDVGIQTGCDAFCRGENGEAGTQIVNWIKASLPPFEAVALLSVCKQLHEECASVLYANTFAFNTGGYRPYGRSRYVHEPDEFQHFSHRIPGYTRNGRPQSRTQLEKSLETMFTPGGYRPKFVARDPMLDFFNRIGSLNTSFITKIQIDGEWKTGRKDYDDPDQIEVTKMGFARILPILTVVLKNACPQLRHLTLHFNDYMGDEQSVWDDDIKNVAGISDQERMDDAVKKVVLGLPNLKVLQLGGQEYFEGARKGKGFHDYWGVSTRWMGLVAERTADVARDEGLKYLANLTSQPRK